MGGLFGGGKSQAAQTPSFTGLDVQTSVLGKPIALVYGQTRVGPNLIWYGDFVQFNVNSGGGGGKGGGGSGKGGNGGTTNYNTAVLMALCEGPVADVGQVWAGKEVTTASNIGLSFFNGSYPQTPFGYLTANHPDQALGYNGVAYLAAGAYSLGNSAQLPNHTFEVKGRLVNSGPKPDFPDADPSQVIVDLLTDPHYGAGFPVERIGTLQTALHTATIPSTPFQITVAHTPLAGNLSVQDAAGNLFTAVTSSPGHRQYSFNAATGVYTFASVDAGTSVTIAYTWLGGLDVYRDYVFALGLGISPAYTDQTNANSILADIATYTDSQWVWSSGVLTLVPNGTVALTGNGHSYTPPASALFDLADDDFMAGSGGSGGDDPVIVTRRRVADQINDVQVEALDRANQYNTAVVQISDQAMIDVFGRRSDQSRQAHMFCDLAAANVSAQLLMQAQYIRNAYAFTIDQRYCLLDPMDIVTLTDSRLGLSRQPVRITEITENDDGSLSIVAEEYPAGVGQAAAYSFQSGTGFNTGYNQPPPDVNLPLFFEPTDELAGGLEVDILVSGTPPDWGGCDVWTSSDGQTYAFLERFMGKSRQGALTASLASVTENLFGPTIDTSHTLSVDISETGLQLNSGTNEDALAGNTLCLIDGELIGYGTATLTGPGRYDLTYLVRGMYGTSPAFHASGAKFGRIDDQRIRIPFTQDRIGSRVHVKFLSFNTYGAGLQTLDQVPAYFHDIVGTALASPLPDIEDLVAVYNSNLTQISWTEIDDFRPLLYEIRRGASFDGGQPLGRVAHPPFTVPGDGTYWVSGYSQPVAGLQVYSDHPQSIAITGATLGANLVDSYDEAATNFIGTVGGAASKVGSGPYTIEVTPGGSGTYEIPTAHQIDVQYVTGCLVSVILTGIGQGSIQNFLDFTDYLNNPDILGSAATAFTDIYAEIRTATTETGGLPNWGNWQKFVPGVYNARFFDARAQIASLNGDTTAILQDMVFAVNAPDRVDDYIGVSLSSSGQTLTYTPNRASGAAPFNGGPLPNPAPNLPQLQVQILDQAAGDIVVFTSQSLASVHIQVKNAGSGVARTVNVLAKGY